MKRLTIAALLALAGAAPPPAEDAAVLRAVLADVGARSAYCVAAALGEAPFAGFRRDLAAAEANDDKPAADAAQRALALRDRISWGWTSAAGKPLDPALLERIVVAAVAIAERGDPTRPPPDPGTIVDLNAIDAADVPVEAVTDAMLDEADSLEAAAEAALPASPPAEADHGRIDATWLAPGQRLAEDCPNPSATLSAVARQDDLAFVSVGLVWAPLAGVGETWVLQRDGATWRRIARRHDWVA